MPNEDRPHLEADLERIQPNRKLPVSIHLDQLQDEELSNHSSTSAMLMDKLFPIYIIITQFYSEVRERSIL